VRILIVEDEEPLAEAVARGLRREGMAVDVALDGDEGHEKATVTRYDVVVLDRDRRTVTRSGKPVELTRKEFGVLEVLLAASGSVVSSEELLERVWDEHADPFTTTVRVTVMTLRKKLGEPGIIDTVVGSGYRVPAAGSASGGQPSEAAPGAESG
jgi:DNA-binding response OmpR family regulator